MRRVRYSVAMSLDGFIAGPQGEADWIGMDPSVDVAAYFDKLYAQFDAVLMGRRTYEVVGGPMQGMATYVFSRTLPSGSRNGVTVLGEDGTNRLAELRAEDGKDIWLFGGGALFGSLASAGLVDSVELGVIPVMLGAGRPVISGNTTRVKLRMTDCDTSPGGGLSVKYAVVA
jgi:dihydrofolate reductase